jgi:hypothetical protein
MQKLKNLDLRDLNVDQRVRISFDAKIRRVATTSTNGVPNRIEVQIEGGHQATSVFGLEDLRAPSFQIHQLIEVPTTGDRVHVTTRPRNPNTVGTLIHIHNGLAMVEWGNKSTSVIELKKLEKF